MFDLNHAISQWRQEMSAGGIKSPAILDELEGHLRDHITRLASGVPDQEAFQIATRELGEPKTLKREFARANRLSLWNWRENPTALKIVSTWLILMGLNAFSQIISLGIVVGPFVSIWTFVVAAVCLFFSCQIAVGIGLLRHISLCRYWAFGFAALNCLSGVGTLVQSVQNSAVPTSGAYYTYFCILIPMSLQWVTATLSVVMSVFAIYILSRHEIRDLFRPKQSLHHA